MNWIDVAVELVDLEVALEVATLGIGFGLSSLFRNYYQSDKHLYDKVSEAKDLKVSNDLFESVLSNPSDFQNIAIVGDVRADGNILVSRFDANRTGVVANILTEEVKEVWGKYTHLWYESSKEICNITESVPFSLVQNNLPIHVHLAEKSRWTSQCLTDVNKIFREPHNSAMDSIMGYIVGDRVKGYLDTERMLLTGTRLLGIGEISVQDNILMLRKPADCELVLATQTKEEFASALTLKMRYWRILQILFLGVSLGGLYFFVKKLFKNYVAVLNERRYQDEVAQVKKMRKRSDHGNVQNSYENEEMCVVCLTNPRECVVLNCGHVCVCLDCVEELPTPRKCPICRGLIARAVPIFHA